MTRLLRLVAAALVVAAAGLTAPAPAAASAAPCTSDTGVTVVVDFNGLGGGVHQVCLAGGGGKSAASLFPSAGFPLSYATRMPGYVCRVNGVPASDPCVNTSPADAYWSLWHSDGDASSWTYAGVAAGSLTVPDGGMVAFSFDDVAGNAPPSASPSRPQAAPAPPPTSAPAGDDGSAGGGQAGPADEPPQAPGSSAPPGAGPSAPPTTEQGERGDRKKRKQRDAQEEQTDGPTPSVEPSSPTATPTDGSTVVDAGADSDDGLPGWMAPVLIAAMFAAAGVVLLVRRRRSAS